MFPASVYQSIFDQSQCGEYLLSPSDDPTILAVNDAFLRTVGRTREELVGQRLFEAFPGNPDDNDETGVNALRGSLHRVIATGTPDILPLQRYPIRMRAPNGTEAFEERYWHATSTPVFGPRQEMVCISHRTEDVTAEWRLQEALSQSQIRAEAALRLAQLGTFEWDFKSGRVQRSARTAEIYAFAPGEGFTADAFFSRLHPDDTDQVKAIVARSLNGDGYVAQRFRIRLPDGSVRHVESMAASERDADGEWARHMGVIVDTTERVRHEQALMDANRRKDEFLAMLAHELRNPLAPIAAAADLLQMASDDPARVIKASAIIARQVRHMVGLVDDLLDVARLTRGRVRLQLGTVDLRQTLLEAIEQVRPMVNARGHELALHTLAEPAWVRGDAKRLVQVVTNVLTNAAKYTPQRGRITVTLAMDAASVTLRVADTGQGMGPALVSHCFDMFVQAERTRERGAGGLGIGLALVRSLAQLHGGSVRAESEGEGRGSCFTVTLPRMALPEGATERQDEPALVAPHHLKVLIVDDNEDAAETLSMLVDSLSHVPTVAHHPHEALACLAAGRPDVCLLDVGLPDMDGYALARAIRQRLAPGPVTLVAITGYGQPQDREDALASGFDEHFAKPVDSQRLAAFLAAVCVPPGPAALSPPPA